MEGSVQLRPVGEEDLPSLLRLLTDRDAPSEFQWFGFRVASAKALERRWRDDGLLGGDESYLAVVRDDDTPLGWVNWRARTHNWEIGIALFPEFRGKGFGTEAQRLLVQYLFDHTTANRIEAGTEVDNVAEQRALEKVGFCREGVRRGVYFRSGRWRDSIMYGIVRADIAAVDG